MNRNNHQAAEAEGRKQKNRRKTDPVFVIAWVLAILSAFFIHPDAAYTGYIDWRSLGILWSLMVVIQGLKENAVFEKIGTAVTGRVSNIRQLSAALIFLCFFGSMLVTNDVALLTFVPLSITLFHGCGKDGAASWLVVLLTIAANLGSMLTPIGNPQNLYLFGLMEADLFVFVLWMLPYTLFTALVLLAVVLLFPGGKEEAKLGGNSGTVRHFGSRVQIGVYLALFLLAMLTVLRILPWWVTAGCTLVIVFGMDFKILKRADYTLLLTFIGFFIFTGNMARIPAVRNVLQETIQGREFPVAVLSSQVISNVPAALLLSDFAADYHELLLGVNIGGLGTMIASMASLISFKFFADSYPDHKASYFLRFTLLNLIMLAFMTVLHGII
ncbi:MAG: citrate transporter [Lachnospiraceae bacterium]|nr:citrate transporter [Lachnospiraceae bacterium]